MAATTNSLPRFFKVFFFHLSSDSMMIPLSYYDELPRTLPKTAILNGSGGCVWKVAMEEKEDEVHFGQGWTKFVKDNSLSDGDFLTFEYDGDCVFEVSIYGRDSCKETRAVCSEVEDDEEDSICSLSSDDSDTSSELEIANAIPSIKNKGKEKLETVEVSDDDDEEDNDDSLRSEDTNTYTSSDSMMAKTVSRSRNKGKKKVKVVEDSYEEDYNIELSGRLGTTRTRGGAVGSKIKNPEAYLDNPNNPYFETNVKNRKFELLIHNQLVKDYGLKFRRSIYYIDNHKYGKLEAETVRWADNRVCCKKWNHVCERNKVKKGDGILCELFREHGLVHSVRVHIVREKDL